MSYLLFLDDVRMPDQVTWESFPRDELTYILRNYDQFIKHISLHGVPEFVCFDHDLADEHYAAMLAESEGHDAAYGDEKTGYDRAKWLVDYCADHGKKFPKYIVHSMNPAGKDRIIGYIENAKKHLGI